MSDMMQTGFDYGALPVELAVSLKLHEDRFIAVRNRATYEMGKEIYEAQQELANHKNGCFQSWVEHLGISYQTGYDLITIYQNAGTDIIKLFDNKKLSQTVSVMLLRSPESVIEKAIEQAEAGDKVTVADVKQWKEAAQAASQRAEEFRQESNARRKKIRELEQQVDLLKAEKPEPEVVEKIIEKPVIPPEFASLEDALKAKRTELENLSRNTQDAIQKNKQVFESRERLKKEVEDLTALLSKHKASEREQIGRAHV